MTPRVKKELILLGVLLVGLAGVSYWNLAGDPAAGAAGPSNSTAPAEQAPASAGPVPDVNIQLLTRESASFMPPRRDPFRFKPKPAPVVRSAAPPPVFVPPPVDPGPPPGPDPRAVIRYVGYVVTASGTRVASLQVGVGSANDGSAVPFVGTEGDIIEGRYRLLRITAEAVEVVELGGLQRRATIARVPPRS